MKKDCCCEGWLNTENGVKLCDCAIQKRKDRIGSRFKDCNLETLNLRSSQKEAKLIKTNPEDSYFLTGNFGTGKTHILVCQYDYLLKLYRLPVVKFFREVDLVSDWQDWENGRYYTTDEFRQQKVKHFFLDDLGRLKITDRVQQEMYDLIDWIYTKEIGLSISSNFSYNELTDIYGGAIVRRIKDICQEIKI